MRRKQVDFRGAAVDDSIDQETIGSQAVYRFIDTQHDTVHAREDQVVVDIFGKAGAQSDNCGSADRQFLDIRKVTEHRVADQTIKRLPI